MSVLGQFLRIVLFLGATFAGLTLLVSDQPILGWSILLGLVALLVYTVVRNRKHFDALIADVNHRHGTHFTRENGFGMGPCLFVDPKARKLLIVHGKDHRFEDFSFVRHWTLKWVEKSNLQTGSLSYHDVHIEIETSNYEAPLLRVPCITKTQGDIWNARFGLLFS